MRIAQLSYWSCPMSRLGVLTAGGMNVYVLNFANYLAKEGHQVDIFTPKHDENDEKILTTNSNVRIIHISHTLTHDSHGALEFGNHVASYILKNKKFYDIVHAHYYLSGLSSITLAAKTNIPWVITYHTLSSTKKRYGGIDEAGRFNTEKEVVANCDGIIASTELEKHELIHSYGASKEKISIVHPGVNHALFRPYNRAYARTRLDLPHDKKIILFVGRIDPIKGIHFLIQAVSRLVSQDATFKDNFRLLLIGGDISRKSFWQHPEVIKIKTIITQKDLECCIKFIGSKPHGILPYYYNCADVVVLPSVYESFGLVVLEAMACGSAVIASRVGGLKYLIEDRVNGLLFSSGNVIELCRGLNTLFTDTKLRNKLGKNAYRESFKYCWDVQAKKLAKAYETYT